MTGRQAESGGACGDVHERNEDHQAHQQPGEEEPARARLRRIGGGRVGGAGTGAAGGLGGGAVPAQQHRTRHAGGEAERGDGHAGRPGPDRVGQGGHDRGQDHTTGGGTGGEEPERGRSAAVKGCADHTGGGHPGACRGQADTDAVAGDGEPHRRGGGGGQRPDRHPGRRHRQERPGPRPVQHPARATRREGVHRERGGEQQRHLRPGRRVGVGQRVDEHPDAAEHSQDHREDGRGHRRDDPGAGGVGGRRRLRVHAGSLLALARSNGPGQRCHGAVGRPRRGPRRCQRGGSTCRHARRQATPPRPFRPRPCHPRRADCPAGHCWPNLDRSERCAGLL